VICLNVYCRKSFIPKRKTQKFCCRECQLRGVSIKDCAIQVEPCATIAQQPLAQETAQRLPANFGLDNCQCQHCKTNRQHDSKLIINHGPAKSYNQLKPGEVNRVSLPGDVDYDGCCVQVDERWIVPESGTKTGTNSIPLPAFV
jgi:hypothetical protein